MTELVRNPKDRFFHNVAQTVERHDLFNHQVSLNRIKPCCIWVDIMAQIFLQ